MIDSENDPTHAEQLREAAAGASDARPEPEAILLDLSGDPNERPKTALEYWRDDVLVYDDWPEDQEAELVFRLFHLRDAAGRSLDLAVKADSPKEEKANLKNAVAALKSAMLTIRALDRYRHGDAQRIIVDHGRGVGLPPGKPLRDPRYAVSDLTIDDAFGRLIGNLNDFERSCRRHAEALSKLRPEELMREFKNGHFEPDCRTWESKYLGLSVYLSGQIVKLREELDRRYTRGHQHIVVERSNGVRAGKVRKIPLVARDAAPDLPQEAEPSFAVAQGVKKVSRGVTHAVSD